MDISRELDFRFAMQPEFEL